LEGLGVEADGAPSVLSNFAKAFLFAFSICVESRNIINMVSLITVGKTFSFSNELETYRISGVLSLSL
jgi:hypothetical protein